MKQNGMTIVGIVCLLIGLFLQFGSGNGISVEDKALCEDIVQQKEFGAEKADLLTRCGADPGFVVLMKAQQAGTNAQETAEAIAAANRSDVGGGMLSLFLMGFGAVLTLGGLFVGKKTI